MISFEEIYTNRPDQKAIGASGYSNLRNLYDICVRLKPDLIVESGTWTGQSSYLFHHFADVVCHDIQFTKLKWRHPSIEYIKEDIEGWSYPTENTLFFFDDHIAHRARLDYLLSIDAKYVVWDDNQPGAIARTLKNPPSPTLEEMGEISDPLFNYIKHYEVMPFYGVDKDFDTRLTYTEL